MADPEIDSTDSLRPLELESVSLDRETAEFKKGKSVGLMGFGLLGIALVAGGVMIMGELDEQQTYGDAGKSVNSLKEDHFDKFWNCTLTGMNQKQIRDNEDLAAQIGKRASRFGHGYAERIAGCAKDLDALQTGLASLSVPADLQDDVAAMAEDAGSLRKAVHGYVAYVADVDADYDAKVALPQLQDVSMAWFQFKKAHSAFTQALKAQLY